MRSVLRSPRAVWIAVAAAAAAAVVVLAVVAVGDHHRKGRSLRKASVAAWFCSHRGERCGERTPQAVESAWNRRERGYLVAGSALALVAIAGGAAAIRTGRRDVGVGSA
jgi:hypothetical protein